MIGLASRLTAGGGREALVRLVLTAAGIALAVTMLLVAAVAFPALHAHDVRRAWTETSEQNQQPAQDEHTTDPLLWRLTEVRFDGRDIVRVDLAPEGPDAPVPPGLEQVPGPGETAVSPALAELLDDTDPAMLADRFGGRVTATVGPDALASPDDLVVFVGHAADELRAEADVATVRSIESAPISRNLTRAMRVVFVVGGVGLLAPVVVFVATATRLAAARREQRLAALRLAGATTGQVGVVAGVEAAIAAVAGVAAGFGLFFAIRPRLARIPFDGASFYPSDLDLSVGRAVAVALAVPALAVAAAVISLRRIRISPLGVAPARRSRPADAPAPAAGGGRHGLPRPGRRVGPRHHVRRARARLRHRRRLPGDDRRHRAVRPVADRAGGARDRPRRAAGAVVARRPPAGGEPRGGVPGHQRHHRGRLRRHGLQRDRRQRDRPQRPAGRRPGGRRRGRSAPRGAAATHAGRRARTGRRRTHTPAHGPGARRRRRGSRTTSPPSPAWTRS